MIEALMAVALIVAVFVPVMTVAMMAVAVIVAVITVAVIGGCGWPGNDGWLWLAHFWLVRSLLAVIGRVVRAVAGQGMPG